MSTELVMRVIDGDTFQIAGYWHFKNSAGDRVRIAHFNAPELHELGGQAARTKLENLILNKWVELKNYKELSYDRLVCDVFLDGEDIWYNLR